MATTRKRAINSIGKECFVKYYFDFKFCTDKKTLAKKLLMENINANSLLAQMTRINYATWIFANKLEVETLEEIAKSYKVNAEARNTAKNMLATNNI